MTKWEYHETARPSTQELADLGREGWELVSVVFIPRQSDPPFTDMPSVMYYIFKRPKPLTKADLGDPQFK